MKTANATPFDWNAWAKRTMNINTPPMIEPTVNDGTPKNGHAEFLYGCQHRDMNAPTATKAEITRLHRLGYTVTDLKAAYGDDNFGWQWTSPLGQDFSDEPHDTEQIAWNIALLHHNETMGTSNA